MKIVNDVSMKNYTTYRTGGNVNTMYFPENTNELIETIQNLKKDNINYFIIGNGSNLIVSDNKFEGAIINIKEMKKYEIIGNSIVCECGVMLPFISMKSINESLEGLEWAISIPGTIGGSIYNNAGAYNGQMADIVEYVDVLDDEYNIIRLTNDECEFRYRTSVFKETKKYIILGCKLNLKKCNKEILIEKVNDRKIRRESTQPLEYPSAGSVFRNPEFAPAGKIIEELNLKGKKIGGAMISDKHANFIINYDNATSTDILDLIKIVKNEVKNKFDIDLILEQEIIKW